MNEPGHIYILINPSMDGYVKIGKTTRDPDSRARELSQATGVAVPFYVAFSIEVADCHSAEDYVYAVLEYNGFQRTPNREFFQMPLRKAIEVLMAVEKHLREEAGSAEQRKPAEETPNDMASTFEEPPSSEPHPGRAIYEAATKAFFGLRDEIKDIKEAIRLLEQAKSLNFPGAFTSLAEYYAGTWGGKSEDLEAAFEVLKEGARRGHGRCFLKMAEMFADRQDMENAAKCYKKYFQSQTFAQDDDEKWGGELDDDGICPVYGTGLPRLQHIILYLISILSGKVQFDTEVRKILLPLREEIISELNGTIQYAEEQGKDTTLDRRILCFVEREF